MNVRLFIISTLLIFGTLTSSAQTRERKTTIGHSPKIEKPGFPAAWVGEWHGTLSVELGMKEVMNTPFHLSIHPLEKGCYTWGIAYGSGKSDNRPYTMCPSDTSTLVHWLIDEHNGITIDGYVHGDVFFSRFEVMDKLLFTRDELKGDTLYHEIIIGPLTGATATGDTVVLVETPGGIRTDSIPLVKSFALSTRQWAKLTRM